MFGFSSSARSLPPKTAKAVCQRMPLTPERIPSFIIPSKLKISSPRSHHEDTDRTRLLSPDHCASPRRRDILSPSFSPSKRSARFYKLSPASAGKVAHAAGRVQEDRTDISTRAAMGLEHVKKISTPYGFRTLAESPHVRRRESLFHRDLTNASDASPGVGSSASGRRVNAARLPSDAELVESPSEALEDDRARKRPSPNRVFKSAKDGLKMFLKKTRYVLRTPSPLRAKGLSCRLTYS
ncbi:C2 calcium-dependent domain-containing protein 4C-like [Alosa alosa]|uniref:C2 calcium-dependent domain-containing protein 4C-like n=1 Tax=Alosa alosa TaxID=278164 RepID=UPI00201525FC|nr:C2 calcium-dependent domain-containing protein 4C-like [Alosa alosa]